MSAHDVEAHATHKAMYTHHMLAGRKAHFEEARQMHHHMATEHRDSARALTKDKPSTAMEVHSKELAKQRANRGKNLS